MHAFAAQGSEQKRKACINFTLMNLFSKWYCNGNTLPHNWNLWGCYVIILVQCNLFMIFPSIVIPVRYQNKFPKFECNVIDLCRPTTYGQLIKIVWSTPLMLHECTNMHTYMCMSFRWFSEFLSLYPFISRTPRLDWVFFLLLCLMEFLVNSPSPLSSFCQIILQ